VWLLIAPKGIEINNQDIHLHWHIPLLIAPKGIEIGLGGGIGEAIRTFNRTKRN